MEEVTYQNKINWEQNDEKIDMRKHLWGVSVTVLLDHLMQESGEERTFGCLPEMHCNSPCQLGVLTSERFYERMISDANLLVDTH